MNFNHVNDHELLSTLKYAVQNEKALTHQVLLYLREIENRKLHLEKDYSSMFAFCTEHLHYSEPEAQIRIQAMRLLKSVPIAEEKIKSGEISLSVAANLQGHFNKENLRRKEEGLKVLSFEEKLVAIQKVRNLSVRKAEQALSYEFPESKQARDKIKPVSVDKAKFEFTGSTKFQEKLVRLQNKLAHKNPNNNLGELIEILADMVLEKIEPKEKPTAKTSLRIDTEPHGAHLVSTKNALTNKHHKNRKYISIKTKRTIYAKSNNQCCYIDKETQTRCTSRYALEIDHILPVALGGTDEIHNLRLLCRAHNQYLGKQI